MVFLHTSLQGFNYSVPIEVKEYDTQVVWTILLMGCFIQNCYLFHFTCNVIKASLLICSSFLSALFSDLNLYSLSSFQVLQKPLITLSLKSDKVYLDLITVSEEVNLNNTNN